jgi:penicillin-binding protein 2
LADHRGAVVALNPQNGDVLALASRPGFDPSLFARGITRSEYAELTDNIDKPLLNRALRGAYPSGSTIKPAVALAGLTYKVLDPDKVEFCDGVFHLPGSTRLFREGKTGRHGKIALQDAIAKSCDVYFYGLAATLGVNRLATFLAPFGYGAVTGIDIRSRDCYPRRNGKNWPSNGPRIRSGFPARPSTLEWARAICS